MIVSPTAPLDDLVAGVRGRLRRRLAWLAFRAEEAGEPLDSLVLALGDGDDRAEEAAWVAAQPELAGLNQAIAGSDAALATAPSRWTVLCERLALTAFCADVLQSTVAVTLEPDLRRAFAALDGWKGRALGRSTLSSPDTAAASA